MTVDVALAPEAERALRQRAAATGKELAVVASELLTQVLTVDTSLTRERMLEISGSSYQHFVSSGMTDEQMAEEMENAKHAARAAKRGVPFTE